MNMETKIEEPVFGTFAVIKESGKVDYLTYKELAYIHAIFGQALLGHDHLFMELKGQHGADDWMTEKERDV